MSKTFEDGRAEVAKQCDFFLTNRERFLAPGVKEAHIRQNLIDPLFEALGWDVANRGMLAPQYREVIPEDSLDVEGAQKAPDYTFRVGPLPKFYVEAKKCGVNIKSDPGPAYQLRRYGWSAKVAVSILTDFEELAVYDCTTRPRETDKASRARIQYFRFDEYHDRWRELWDVFSREAVWSGAFDQFAGSKRKRGTSEVDVEFLKEIERWRESLARNIALRNKSISSEELNAAVQLTIDRVVFLRMAEDRGLEPYEQLAKLCERPDVYARFIGDLCRKADEKYNSGLFHFQKEAAVSEAPDRITPKLVVDDKVFAPILQSLYFTYGSPYHFGVMPVEILGTVYERFLGKVIRLTTGHQAKIEEKPEVRKAGGVYYTPAYIVNYIVKQTVERQIEGRSPAQLAGGKSIPPFRVLDMACGSGSFLLGAYQCILDYCLNWYINHNPAAHKRAVHQDPHDKHWRLTIEEKKRILTTHLYGVDIDPQAVEVTKLSLLLKALEGENDATLALQLRLFHERALPNLVDNIKCGNSLVQSDFFLDNLIADVDELNRVRPFDWETEFGAAMANGGFDAVIGNPPWVSLNGRFGNDICSAAEQSYLIDAYHGNSYMPNLYEYFISKGIRLVRSGGRFGYIVPDRLAVNGQFTGLRKRILDSFTICSLVYRLPFPGVTADTLLFVLENRPFQNNSMIAVSDSAGKPVEILQSESLTLPNYEFPRFENPAVTRLKKKLGSLPSVVPLREVCNTTSGFGGKSELITDQRQSSKQIPTMKGDSIARYSHRKHYWFDFTRKNITGRTTDKNKLGARPKVLLRKTGNLIVATYDDSGVFPEQSLYFLFNFKQGILPLYTLGLLNSKLMNWYYRAECLTNANSIAQVKKIDLDKLPIRVIDKSRDDDSAIHDRIVSLVSQILKLHGALESSVEGKRLLISRQISSTDLEIDRLVYKLYSLTADEIATVEGSTNIDATPVN